ncbi:ABC transporter permease [Streptomyces malaysiensis subsp. malaysiensis]|uniref:ABC transporter permease n=1 Tax=Streptomyces malaysiensis TaxID=92644 RepID=UPI0024BF82EC|nr:ABC transporter permease [Streptomyces sp. NA07423]WHX15854.1 ABC transporter permease [Streptomyces sp. NA07423]
MSAATAAVETTPAKKIGYPPARLAGRRILEGIITLFALSLLVFLATAVLPGDAASSMLGKQATGPALKTMRHAMGSDQPLISQYGHWLSGLLHGDLGNTAAGYAAGGQVSVWSQISGKLGHSLIIAGMAFVPIVVLSVLVGVYTALKAGRWQDQLLTTVTLVPAALPEFVLGTVLLAVLFTWLDFLPPVSFVVPGTSPLSNPATLVLPILTLVGVTVGPAARMIRAGMLEALEADTVTVARLNGLREGRVVRRYALRNALAPSIQVFALIAQYLIGGLLIVENLFGYPGIGKELVDAVTIHDNLEVQSVTMLLAAFYVAVTIVADLLVMIVVPKLRTGASR